MLVLKRKEGQWIEIAHKSGDTIRIRVYNIRSRFPGQVDLAFDDDCRNFDVQRPERVRPLSSLVREPAIATATATVLSGGEEGRWATCLEGPSS